MGLFSWLFQSSQQQTQGDDSNQPSQALAAAEGSKETSTAAVPDACADGYEIYDLFEGDKGARVPAQRRIWVELLEEGEAITSFCPAPSSSTVVAVEVKVEVSDKQGGPQLSAEPLAAGAAPSSNEVPWVVLMPTGGNPCLPSGPAPAPKPRVTHRPGKAPAPPPPKGKGAPKGKGPPPPPFGKAKSFGSAAGLRPQVGGKKATPPPPPFGKRLHWRLLPPDSLEDTIFEELQPWGEASGAPPLDTRHIERLFAPPAPRERAASLGGPDGTSNANGAGAQRRSSVGLPGMSAAAGLAGVGCGSGAKKGQVCLLDAKRAQNLAIVLRQVAVPTEELAEVLRWMRVSHPVNAESLEHVYENLLPHLLDAGELASYEGPLEVLRDVERQLIPLVRVPRVKARLRAMIFSKSMPKTHGDILTRIRSLTGACAQVRGSAALRRVLGTVLRVGNYLNHGVDAPDAGGGVEVRGFAVESLLKLRDFRASQAGEASASALHCVALHLLQGDPQLLARLKAELRCCNGQSGEIAGVGSAGDLRDAVNRFQSEIDLVQCEIDRFGDSYGADGTPVEACGGPLVVLRRLAEDAREMATSLQAEIDEALLTGCRLLEYFGEPARRDGDQAFGAVEKFFSTIGEFVASFEDCWREVVENPRKLRLEGVGFGSSAGPSASGGAGASNPGGAATSTPWGQSKVRGPPAPPSRSASSSVEASSSASSSPRAAPDAAPPRARPGWGGEGRKSVADDSRNVPTRPVASYAQAAAATASAATRKRAAQSDQVEEAGQVPPPPPAKSPSGKGGQAASVPVDVAAALKANEVPGLRLSASLAAEAVASRQFLSLRNRSRREDRSPEASESTAAAYDVE